MKQRKGKFWFPGENQRIGTTRYDWCNDDYYSRALYPLTLHAANNFVAQRDGRLISRDNPSPPRWFDSFRSIYATFETTFLNIPSRRSNRFLKIILQSCQSLRIRVDFYLRIFLLCSSSLFPSPFFFFYSAPFFVSMRKSRLLLCWNGSKFRCLRNGGPAGGEKKSKKDLGRDRWRTVSRNISNACCCLVTNTVSPSMFTVLCCAGRGNIVI